MRRILVVLLCMLSLLGLYAGAKAEIQESMEYNGLEILQVYSPSIQENLIEEDPLREVQVYLPPDYHDSTREYPVVFFLAGYMQRSSMIHSFVNSLDHRFEAHPEEAFLLVALDGANQNSGSFYQNSPVTGNWEDFVVDEMVPLIDSQYRTLATRESRGISGFSMGGYGAWELAFKHPQVFGHLFSVSPGAFDENGLEDAMTDGGWDAHFHRAYGSAFAPNPGEDPPYQIPSLDGSAADEEIREMWNRGFGNIEEKLDRYLEQDSRLIHIFFLYGNQDGYSWIVRGTEFLGQAMEEREIPHSLFDHGGGHTFNFFQVENHMLPFFAQAFQE